MLSRLSLSVSATQLLISANFEPTEKQNKSINNNKYLLKQYMSKMFVLKSCIWFWIMCWIKSLVILEAQSINSMLWYLKVFGDEVCISFLMHCLTHLAPSPNWSLSIYSLPTCILSGLLCPNWKAELIIPQSVLGTSSTPPLEKLLGLAHNAVERGITLVWLRGK